MVSSPVKAKSNSRNSRGFSLVEMMVTVAISGVLTLAAASMLKDQYQMKQQISLASDMNAAHAVSLQSARNLQWVQTQIATVAGSQAAMLNRCLQNRANVGDDCTVFNDRHSSIDLLSGGIGNNSLTSNANVTVNCTSTSCADILVNVQTSSPGLSHARQTTVKVLGANIASNSQITSNCGSTGVISGVNLGTRQTECTGALAHIEASCGTTGPLQSLGGPGAGCQPMEAVNCNTVGANKVGLFASTSSCGGPTPL